LYFFTNNFKYNILIDYLLSNHLSPIELWQIIRDIIAIIIAVITGIKFYFEIRRLHEEKTQERLSKIHTKQIELLSRLYAALEPVVNYSRLLTKSYIIEGEDIKKYPNLLNESLNNALNEYALSKLFLSSDLVSQIDSFFNKVLDSQIELGAVNLLDRNGLHGSERAIHWEKAASIAHSEMPKILASIEEESRTIISGENSMTITEKRMKKDSKHDWFARVTAIIGLMIAMAAILVPYYKDKTDSQESLGIAAFTEERGGILKLSDNIKKSQAIQMPWIVTLSNTGRVKLSITSYSIQKIEANGVSYFPGLEGGAYDSANRPLLFPLTLDAGESKSFRLYIGFLPSKEVETTLRDIYDKHGPVDYHTGFVALARKGITFYGDKASYTEDINGHSMITIDQSSYNKEPIYKISFTSGRGNVFIITTSEMTSNSNTKSKML
jgi:hypothetical protein